MCRLHLKDIRMGHAMPRLEYLSSLMGLADLSDDLVAGTRYLLQEWSSAHALSLIRLLMDETFCTSFLGRSGALLENSDSVNPLGGSLATGFAPGPSDVRTLFSMPADSGEPWIVLFNDMPGQGIAACVQRIA